MICVSVITGIVCFKQKTNICNAKFVDLGLMGTWIEICRQKCHIWSRWLWFAYPLCNFYGATMMIKGSLLLSTPIVKHCWSKFAIDLAW